MAYYDEQDDAEWASDLGSSLPDTDLYDDGWYAEANAAYSTALAEQSASAPPDVPRCAWCCREMPGASESYPTCEECRGAADAYPADHDPVFAALVHASGLAKARGKHTLERELDRLIREYES